MYKIRALISRDMRVLRNTKFRIIDVLYFPITSVIIWGLFATFAQSFALEAGLIVLIVNIFWSFASLAQHSVNLYMNEDVWSGSLKQILATGITEFEYLAARIVSSGITAVIIMAVMLLAAFYWFGAGVIMVHSGPIAVLSIMTLISSIALAVVVSGLIVTLGREYMFLAWSAIQLFILLSAPFYPVSIFPEAVQYVAWVMPFTYAFEGVRMLVETGTVVQSIFINGFIVSVIYMIASLPFYRWAFQRARRTGGLVRLT